MTSRWAQECSPPSPCSPPPPRSHPKGSPTTRKATSSVSAPSRICSAAWELKWGTLNQCINLPLQGRPPQNGGSRFLHWLTDSTISRSATMTGRPYRASCKGEQHVITRHSDPRATEARWSRRPHRAMPNGGTRSEVPAGGRRQTWTHTNSPAWTCRTSGSRCMPPGRRGSISGLPPIPCSHNGGCLRCIRACPDGDESSSKPATPAVTLFACWA